MEAAWAARAAVQEFPARIFMGEPWPTKRDGMGFIGRSFGTERLDIRDR